MMSDGTSTLSLMMWDVHEEFSLVGNSAIGIIQVLCGLLSMALGVGAICTWASGYYIAYGIWCGFLFTVTGGIAIGAARHKNTCLIMTTMVLSIMSVFCGIVQFSLGVVAAENDAFSNRGDIISGSLMPASYLQWDIYYYKNNPYIYLCAGENNSLGWKSAWGPIDILLLLTGFIEAVTALAGTILCCQVVCCGLRRVSGGKGVYYNGNTGTGTLGYSNTGYATEGYATESRISPAPPLYKRGGGGGGCM